MPASSTRAVGLAPDQALPVARGVLDETTMALRELAEDNDSTAAVRLAELLCERHEIKAAISTLKPFAQRSHAASEFLVRLLVSQEDLQSLGELATAGGILAAKELVKLVISQGSYDDLNTAIRTLAVMERDVGGQYPIIALTRLRRKRRAWEREREQARAAQHQPSTVLVALHIADDLGD